MTKKTMKTTTTTNPTNPKAETMKTTTTAAASTAATPATRHDGLRSKNAPRDPDRTQRVSRAIAGLGATPIAEVMIGEERDVLKWIKSNLPSVLAEGGNIITARADGRKIAVYNVRFTVELALSLIRLNSHNRAFRPHHAQLHAEKFRLPCNDQNGFDSDISQVAIFFDFDPETGLLRVSALADGQHRAFAKIAADGTYTQYHTAWHYIECHRANLDRDPKDCRNLDWVEVAHETDYTDPISGKICSGAVIPLDQWARKLDAAKKRGDAGAVEIANLTNGRDEFTNWTLREDLHDAPEESCPFVTLIVGADRRTLSKYDQNNLARTGGDELDMSTETGPRLRKIGLPAETAATLVRNLWLRIKPHVSTTKIEKDEDGNPVEVTRTKRGELSDGGKPIAPPSYPAYYLSSEIGPRIETVWEQWVRHREIVKLWEDTNPHTPKHANHPAAAEFAYCRASATWDKAKGEFEPGSGYMIPDQLVILAACLIECRNCGKSEAEYVAEVSEFILRAAYGLHIDEMGRYCPDGVFADVRDWILAKKRDGGSYKAGELLDQMARAWNFYTGLPIDEIDAPERFQAYDPDRDEYIGADLLGVSEDIVKQIQAAQRGQEFVPGRKRGRPAGAKTKNRKA